MPDTAESLVIPFLQNALQARGEFVRRMEAIGATIKFDDMANLYATLPGSEPDLPGIVMASHCDSVKNGGKYDGALGVVTGVAALGYLKQSGFVPKHSLEVGGLMEEEGSRFSIRLSGGAAQSVAR